MKLLCFFLFAAFISVYGKSTAQEVTLSGKNLSLKKIFSVVREQTGYVLFSKKEILQQAKPVTITVKAMPLQRFLEEVLKDQQLLYIIRDNTIFLYHKSASAINVKLNVGTPQVETVKMQSVSGVVTDNDGEPVPGVNVVVKGSTKGTVTDAKGNYTLQVAENDTLVFSSLGYATQHIRVGNLQTINVKLEVDQKSLGEVVVVAYGAKKKESLTGSIASVKGENLSRAPIASTTNALAGRLPGLISQQSSGQPGADAATLSIRGFGGALIIVDGVEADFNTIDANSIESISVLKDGAASMYGARAGNGVILVTTKRGIDENPVFNFNTSYTGQGITAFPKRSSSGQIAEMTRETYLQSGQPPQNAPFTEEQIRKYYDGTDPQYPNTDWYNILIKEWAPQQNHNLSVRGGNKRLKYYAFVGYLNQSPIWKLSDGGYKRYNVQSNIDAKIAENLSLQFDISVINEYRDFPWRSQRKEDMAIWQDFWTTNPMYPAAFPDLDKVSFAGGSGTGGAHVTSNSKLTGYNRSDNQNIRGTISLNYVFKGIKGLSAKAFVNYRQDYSFSKVFVKPVKFYTYNVDTKTYTEAGALNSQATLSQSTSKGRILNGQFSLNYERTFLQKHYLSALALYEVIDYSDDNFGGGRQKFITPLIDQLFVGALSSSTINGSASEMGRKSYVGRLNYSFRNKYLLEASLRADASAKFPANTRWGYFPSVSVGWRISEEFASSARQDLFDDLKLRASYGESGNDGVGNFQYLAGYQVGDPYMIGGTQTSGLVPKGLANPNLTWERVTIYNAGLEFSLFKRKLYGEMDAFYRTRSGIPATRIGTFPTTFGASLPPENINSLNDRGFELMLGTAGKISDLSWDLSGNISWSRSKWDHYEEPPYTNPDQARLYKNSKRWTDRMYGYVSDGLFTSQEQIDKLDFDLDGNGNSSVRPGDMRYVDVNKDGKLDYRDQVEIGKGTVPHWMVGVTGNLKYKNFDLSALFQGAFGYYNRIIFNQGLFSSVYYDLRWTEKNNDPNALIPRLGGANNFLPSDHNYRKAGYLRLKTLAIGYNLPKAWLDKIKFKQLRIYAAGTNLLTLNPLRKYETDPEAPSGYAGYYYPQQRTVTLGANISF